MATNDRPASPQEKLYVRLEQATAVGKAFDESLERKILGLPPAEARAPIILAERADRKAQIVRDDAAAAHAALSQMKEAAVAASEDDMRKQIALLKAENARLANQVADVTGATPPPPTPQPAAPTAAPTADATAFPAGAPTEQWTARQLIEFNRTAGLPPLVRGGTGMSKRAILDHILTHLPAPDAAAEEGAA